MTRKTTIPKVWIPHQLVSRPDLNPRIGALFGVLRMYAGHNSEAYPSVEQLRRDLGLSTRRQCLNLIADAKRLGLIRVEQREKSASVYRFTEHPWLREERLSSEQVSGREYPVLDAPWKHPLFKHSVPVPLALLRRSELCPRAAILYGLLSTYAQKSGHAFAKRGTYADRMGSSPQRISDLTGELTRTGLISVRLHRGQHRASNITLVKDHAWLREQRQEAAQPEAKAAPKLSIVRTDHQPQAAPRADLCKVEQAWRAAMTEHFPAVPVAKGDWNEHYGPGASAAKLLRDYSAEQVIRYVAWVPEAWAGLARRHPKHVHGAPTIGIAASSFADSWMPEALGAVAEDPIALLHRLNAEASRQMDETGNVFLPGDLSSRIARAHAAACAAGWKGKL